MYRVEVDWAPAYEPLVSLKAFCSRPEHRTLELGPAWASAVRRELAPWLASELSSPQALAHVGIVDLLIYLCRREREVIPFLDWLASLSAAEMYELVSPYALEDGRAMPRDLGAVRDRYARVLRAWNEQYFRSVDPAVLEGLRADAAVRRALIATTDPVQLVEQATTGLEFLPQPEPEVVVLVPQYHYRPWNLFSEYYGMRHIEYPADPVPPAPGVPSPGLLRLTRALSDESRLRILRFLAGGPSSFTGVVQFSGLSKSTVHHHLVALRAAGLVRVHELGEKTTYSLRPGALEDLGDRLRAYLTADPSEEPGGGRDEA